MSKETKTCGMCAEFYETKNRPAVVTITVTDDQGVVLDVQDFCITCFTESVCEGESNPSIGAEAEERLEKRQKELDEQAKMPSQGAP